MITKEEAAGFLAVVYDTMERMTTKDRGWLIKALKMAKKSMDINYPNGKQPEPVVTTGTTPVELITPVTEGLIIPGGHQ